MILSGATMSGKTTFLYNFLQYRNDLLSKKHVKVFLFYKKHQPMYNQMLKYKLVDEIIEVDGSMPSLEDFQKKVKPLKEKGGCLCIFDDLMEQIDESNAEIFTKEAHHENCSVIFVTQLLFVDNKSYRAMSRNVSYFILMKNPRDSQSVKTLGSQTSNKILFNVFMDATKNAYSYLVVDFHPTTPEHVRLRSRILPNEAPMKVFMEANCI